ncbi:MAG: hypothetical protein COT74_07215 [Bdellovibrionales bacterium CG10_big_fil_rev_8_21_14_0_10_45_34]|nr:MAG: hypothetical protein COT74_07215 [Bdellovibrionales bacterium CG10_big_fil_rev_8_21_14_0_10_45_34]
MRAQSRDDFKKKRGAAKADAINKGFLILLRNSGQKEKPEKRIVPKNRQETTQIQKDTRRWGWPFLWGRCKGTSRFKSDLNNLVKHFNKLMRDLNNPITYSNKLNGDLKKPKNDHDNPKKDRRLYA